MLGRENFCWSLCIFYRRAYSLRALLPSNAVQILIKYSFTRLLFQLGQPPNDRVFSQMMARGCAPFAQLRPLHVLAEVRRPQMPLIMFVWLAACSPDSIFHYRQPLGTREELAGIPSVLGAPLLLARLCSHLATLVGKFGVRSMARGWLLPLSSSQIPELSPGFSAFLQELDAACEPCGACKAHRVTTECPLGAMQQDGSRS